MKQASLTYIGHFLAACMDFAMGILIVSILGSIFSVEIPLWVYVLGAFLAVLPDMDIILDVLKGSDLQGWDHHLTIMHRPTVILPTVAVIGAFLGFFLGSPLFYSLVFILCVFWHYLHDTKGFGGGGIAWLWPVSRMYWGFSGGEIPEEVRTREEPFYLEWIKPTALSVRELGFVVIILTGAAFFDIQLSLYASYLLPLFSACVLLVWMYTETTKKPL